MTWNKLPYLTDVIPTDTFPVSLAAKFVAADTRYLTHVDAAALSVGDIYWDMVVWVKFTSFQGNDRVFTKWQTWPDCEYQLIGNAGGLLFFARDGADANYIYCSAATFGALTQGVWYMVHMYHNPATNMVGIGVNAGAHDTAAIVGGIRDGTSQFEVGAMSLVSGYLNGDVGPLAIWKPTGTNLTAAQLTWLYNSGYGRDSSELGITNTDGSGLLSGLQAWWQMTEVSGTRYDDLPGSLPLAEVGGTVSSEAGLDIRCGRKLVDADIPAAIMRDAEHTAIGDGAPHHPAITLGGGSDAALSLAAGQVLTLADVLTPAEHTAIGNAAPHHAAITLGGGSDPALALAGQQLTLADVLTPAEHTAIGDAAPHHAPITIHADLNTNLLALAAQQLDLDTQVANRVFAGPAAAGPSKPTFRSMVAADLPVEAIVDADFAAGEGFMRKTGAGTYIAHKSNLASAANPGVNNDAAAGYSVGSVWINTTLDVVWQCVDSTNGNAVWKDLSTAVTLDANADTILSLATQALGLDVQVANKVFSGPRDGLAAKFVAADARYLVHADDAALSVGDIYWDMVVWVNLPNLSIRNDLVNKYTSWGAGGWEYALLSPGDGMVYFYARNGADAAYSSVSRSIPAANTWFMVHCYHDPTANIIGLSVNNGAPVTVAIVGGIRDAACDVHVGAIPSEAHYMTGDVGPLTIWKPTGTNLTAAQLTWLYNGGYGRNFTEIGRQDDGQYLGPVAGLQTWWQMDEITGTRAPTFSTLLLTESGGAVSSEAGISSGPVVPGFRALIDSDLPRKSNLAAVAAPGAGDDCTKGYTVGSEWINIVAGTVYKCVNATAAGAVWTLLG